MSSLPKAYDPSSVEARLSSFWEERGFCKADASSAKPPFSIIIPPPNVTGVLHMGHALVDTIQDILIRWKRMQGFEVLWVPGTDHAGIATQTVVERSLLSRFGKRRGDFSREEFLEHVWSWKEKSEKDILGQLRKLGCSFDLSRLCFTMDPTRNRAVRCVFKKMFDDGLIYRGERLVNWDPVTQTALSDDEVEHEERDSFLWHIRYPLASGKGYLVVATTRPETMLGDMAVAVHPNDKRYQKLLGDSILLPLTDRKIPIVADPFVDPEFGSGAVKVTPAHDFNDFEIGQRHDLPLLNILTPDGRMNEKCGSFAGLGVEEAREAVLSALVKADLLEKKEPHVLRVGLSYRSKAVLQPYLSKQWFINMRHFKEKLLSAVFEKRVELIPPHWEETYRHWIENIRDWCISRQIWWGHQIPIWYNRQNPEKILCFDGDGVPPEVALDPNGWVRDPDVLDTWFSSALWPFSVFGWPDKTDDLKKFYPTSTLVTGHDILFFWVARMILMGEYVLGEVPFKEAFLHGLIYGKSYWKKEKGGGILYITGEEKKKYDLGAEIPRDVSSKWEKMSKSKGNIIDPLEVIAEYGTDALRIALASSVTHARQIDLDLRKFEEFKNFANKIWNGARFVLMNLEDFSSDDLEQGIDTSQLRLEDQWILSLYNRTVDEVNGHLSRYAFDKASERTYEFFWNDFCAVFVELSKPILFGKVGDATLRKNKQKLLVILLLGAIRLLHPITPFITEELFSILKQKFPNLTLSPLVDVYTQEAILALQRDACIVAPYPKQVGPVDPEIEANFALLQDFVRSIRNLRTEMQIPPGEKSELFVIGPLKSREVSLVQREKEVLSSLVPIQKIHFQDQEPTHFGATALVGAVKLMIPLPDSLKEKEKVRLEKEKEKLQKMADGTKMRLGNAEFRGKAPSDVVEKLELNFREMEKQLLEISQKIRELS